MKTTILLMVVLLSGIVLAQNTRAQTADPYADTLEGSIACAKAIQERTPDAKCMCSIHEGVTRNYDIEALCLFAPDSAFAGSWPVNPIISDSVINYVRAHNKYAAEGIDSNGALKYFEGSLYIIHQRSVAYKIDMCDVYHTR